MYFFREIFLRIARDGAFLDFDCGVWKVPVLEVWIDELSELKLRRSRGQCNDGVT